MNESYWMKQVEKKKTYPSITADMSYHIVIIGAGLTGLTTAYYTSNTTQDIAVIEADRIGYGASGRNTGKITLQHGAIYHLLLERYDKIFASKYYHAQLDAMRSIDAIIKEHHITCDYQERDALLYTADPANVFVLQDEYQAYQDLGIKATFMKNEKIPFPIEAGIVLSKQASYNPYAYCLGLSDVLDERKISIYEHSPVTDLAACEEGGYDLSVNGVHIHANKVVFACQFPFIDHMHLYFARMKPIQETLCAAPLKESVHEAMMINLEEETYSANKIGTTLVMSGNKHKSGQGSEDAYHTYKKQLYQIYPIHEIEQEWSNEDYISFDHLPLIGKLDRRNDDVYFAAGFNAWGNTTSNMAAKILSGYVLGQYGTYAMLASPQRASFLSLPFIKENMNTALQFIKGRWKKEDLEYPIRKQAKQLEIDGHMYGVYRDEHDEIYVVDITCPHMGCILNFNHIDQTWDCPCHGSRFSYKGEVIKGPSALPLHPYGDELNTVDPHISKK